MRPVLAALIVVGAVTADVRAQPKPVAPRAEEPKPVTSEEIERLRREAVI